MHATKNKTEMKTAEEFFNGEGLCLKAYEKYALRDRQGQFVEQCPDQTIDRVMTALASVDETPELTKRKFVESCAGFKGVVPQGSVLFGAGNTSVTVSLSNCFVIQAPSDSIFGIFQTSCEEAQIMKRRGGVGFDLSTLRPSGAATNNSSLTSSGSVGWADHFSNVCRAIGQNNRRGALMLTLDISHPDAELFALMKKDLTKVTGANVSLKISDAFMHAVEADEEFEQRWPLTGTPQITKRIRARQLWQVICQNAWEMAEPGILMWDNITKNLPAHCYPNFQTVSTNPCGEIPLSVADSCRLISINLPNYVQHKFSKESLFDYEHFVRDVITAMRMSDNLVSLELQHVQQILAKADSESERALWQKIYQAGEQGRRTGLGTHGLADALAQLGWRYDSDRALQEIDQIYRVFRDTAYSASIDLAKTRGAFPCWDWEIEKDCAFLQRLPADLLAQIKQYGRRNISILTMAPTGTISTLSKASSGIEPVFRNVYIRQRKINHNDVNAQVDRIDALGDKWQDYKIIHWNVSEYLRRHPQKTDKDLPDYFVSSDKIDWKQRVVIQGKIQQYIDHSISSTINVPKDISVETVQELYLMGWKQGLKGITVYRDGCRDGVLLSEDSRYEARPNKVKRQGAPKRPESLPCDIHHTMVNGHPWVVMVGKFEGEPYEVFAGKASKVHVPKKYTEGMIVKDKKSYFLVFNDDMKLDIIECFTNDEQQAITRLLSMSLRHGTPLPYVVQQLDKAEGSKITDLNKAIMRILKRYMKDEDAKLLKCSECGSPSLVMENGCYQCKECGSSKCS